MVLLPFSDYLVRNVSIVIFSLSKGSQLTGKSASEIGRVNLPLSCFQFLRLKSKAVYTKASKRWQSQLNKVS